jgi:hypothetical protein
VCVIIDETWGEFDNNKNPVRIRKTLKEAPNTKLKETQMKSSQPE